MTVFRSMPPGVADDLTATIGNTLQKSFQCGQRTGRVQRIQRSGIESKLSWPRKLWSMSCMIVVRRNSYPNLISCLPDFHE